jgi:predicted phage terminase large subunit-like protein
MPNFQSPAHILRLIALWSAIEIGAIRRALISLPPRHGKSMLWTLVVPWILGRHPDWQVAAAAYSAELTEIWGRKIRTIMTGDSHQDIFPDCRICPDSAAAHRFDLTRGGGARFVGRGGTLVGTGAHLLIVDDLYANGEEARSDKTKQTTQEWFTEALLTRAEPNGAVVVIGSRWCEDDVIGTLLREHSNDGWVPVVLPAIAEANDPLGRVEGEALWPERFDITALEAKRRELGSAAFTNIYQGQPAAAEGVVFKREWFRYYHSPLPSFQRKVQSWDTAYGKSTTSGDYSVCTTWGVNNAGYYLVSLWRGRVDFPKLKWMVGQQADEHKPNAILIEDHASGPSLIQELRTASNYPVIPVKADRDKRARAEAVTPMFEASKVFFPADVSWRRSLEDELALFPTGAHDDQVDSMTMALNYLREGMSNSYPTIITSSEPMYSVGELRHYLDAQLYPERRIGWPW